ncbi:FG-GAP repeat domain-containing protein [Shewanella maritima]|uniref:FG-GAP repeat domain-containing protein n=1 Tax=Shewanella maritima TaxID=2520507 RepID=UPI003734C164
MKLIATCRRALAQMDASSRVQQMVSRIWGTTCLLGCAMVTLSPNIASAIAFKEYKLTADIELTQPIVSANVLAAEGNELIVVGVDDQYQRWLIIYGYQNQQLTQLDKLLLTNDLFRYDVYQADNDPQAHPNSEGAIQGLFFINADTLYQFVPSNAQQPSQLVEVTQVSSITQTSSADYISRGRFALDINRDGLGDIVLSDFHQTHVLLGKADGQLHSQSVPLKPIVEVTRSGAEYSRAEVFSSDMNFDNLSDLVKVGEGMLEVYFQQENGQFDPVPNYISVSQPISGINWWNKRDAYGRQLDQSDLLYRKVEQIKDMNGDGITDLVVRYTKSSGVFDRSNDYEVYLGQVQQLSPDGAKTVNFGREAATVIKADGTLTGLRFSDLDNDNIDEVVVSGFDVGVSQIIGALLSGSIDQDVYVFKMDNNNRFPSKANESKQVELNFSLTSGQSGEPVVALGDLNGDSYKELILSDSDDKLKIYNGQSGKQPFSSKSSELSFTLPTEGSMLSVSDINSDGLDDLLVQYGRQDEKSLQRQLRVFIAEPK